MNVIITGASGFVGTNLTKYLGEHAVKTHALSMRNNSWKTHLVTNADAIIHLAGKAHDLKNTSEAADYFKINRDLTIELYNEFLNSDIQDFFYFSSVKAVADNAIGVIDEQIVPNPKTPYGRSKFEAEQYLLSKVLPKGKRLFIIRPCMIHGPGNKGNLNLLYKIVDKRIPWPLTKFENQRSFLSVDNLNYLLLEMIRNKSVASGIYNFADDASLSTNQLIIVMNKAIGYKARFLHINTNIIKWVAKIGDKVKLPLNSERLDKLTESYVVSNTKIKKALSIEQLPLNAEDGLRKTIVSFKK